MPSVDPTQLLQHHGARAWALHQHADVPVTVRVVGGDARAVRAALGALLDVAVTVEVVERLEPGPDRRCTSDVPGAAGF